MRRSLKLLALAAVLAVGALALWRDLDREMDRPAPATVPVRVEVLPGEPLRGILLHLQQQGALRHARLVEWYLRVHGQNPRVQAGTYEVAPHSCARSGTKARLRKDSSFRTLTALPPGPAIARSSNSPMIACSASSRRHGTCVRPSCRFRILRRR